MKVLIIIGALLTLLGVVGVTAYYLVPPNPNAPSHGWTQDPSNPPPVP